MDKDLTIGMIGFIGTIILILLVDFLLFRNSNKINNERIAKLELIYDILSKINNKL